MRMIVADDKTDCLSALAVGMIPCIAVMIHRIQDPPLDRLQAITGIRQSSFLNNILCISAKPLAHDIFQQFRSVFCLVINLFFLCHYCSTLKSSSNVKEILSSIHFLLNSALSPISTVTLLSAFTPSSMPTLISVR